MGELLNFFRGIVPSQSEIAAGSTVSVFGTVFCYLFGCWDALIEALIAAMAIDYASGMIAAYINPKKKLNSIKGMKGILKKVLILLVVALAHFAGNAIGQEVLTRSAVILFFLGNEGLSIIENVAKAGLPVPQKLKESLEQLASEKMEVRK